MLTHNQVKTKRKLAARAVSAESSGSESDEPEPSAPKSKRGGGQGRDGSQKSVRGKQSVVDSHWLVQAFEKSLPGPPKAHGPGGLRPNRVISTRESSGSQN
jgi:hypothetical protein